MTIYKQMEYQMRLPEYETLAEPGGLGRRQFSPLCQ